MSLTYEQRRQIERKERLAIDQKRFTAFVADLTELSKKHGIALSVCGGVDFYDSIEEIHYCDDVSSGDLYYDDQTIKFK